MRCCGTCEYNKWVDGEFVCSNHDGEYFGYETTYDDKCPDWEEKEQTMEKEQIIADTTKMAIAAACLALNKRNKFGVVRLTQFIADVMEINEKMEYDEIVSELKEKGIRI